MTQPPSRAALQEVVDALAKHGTQVAAARALGLPRETYRSRLREAQTKRMQPGDSPEALDAHELDSLRARVASLGRELTVAKEQALTAETIKRKIIGLQQNIETAPAPHWIEPRDHDTSAPGVPALFCSDWHWGESVEPSQIGGVNAFDVKTAKKRVDKLMHTAVHLLSIISPKLDYPGIVFILGGDMISGNIHEELTATNELNSMPAVLDLYSELVACIEFLAEHFGNVFVPCVTGNHGRDTRKIWSKDRHHTSFDWLLYCFLAKRFENDDRISFLIPDGPDAHFRIYSHRYLLTHGDQFRGGDGMIGALGPITRGDHKKRSRNSQINMGYDTLLMGHWHQYIHLDKLIVNGSLKGYDEYAYANNFAFEIPQQALWITHPQHRITFRMPVHLGQLEVDKNAGWVSVGGKK